MYEVGIQLIMTKLYLEELRTLPEDEAKAQGVLVILAFDYYPFPAMNFSCAVVAFPSFIGHHFLSTKGIFRY